jgi:hypothetical protein
MVQSIEGHKREFERRSQADIHADRLEALLNLAFLMRVDIDRRENLREYLKYVDIILEGMTNDEVMRGREVGEGRVW